MDDDVVPIKEALFFYTNFPMSLVFLYLPTSRHYTTHTHTTRISMVFPMGISVFFHTHAHTRTSARATDRDLASGLSKSVCVRTRKMVNYA